MKKGKIGRFRNEEEGGGEVWGLPRTQVVIGREGKMSQKP